MSAQECREANWYEVGVRDGMERAGGAFDRNYVKTCGEHHVQVNEREYDRGYKEGLKSYCTIDMAKRNGEIGKPYNFEDCASEVRDLVTTAYYEGALSVYKKRSNDAFNQQQKILNRTKVVENELKLANKMSPELRIKIEELIIEIKKQSDNVRKERVF